MHSAAPTADFGAVEVGILLSYQLGCEPTSTVASQPFGQATLSSVQPFSSKVSYINAGLKPSSRVADFKRVMLEHLAPSRPYLP